MTTNIWDEAETYSLPDGRLLRTDWRAATIARVPIPDGTPNTDPKRAHALAEYMGDVPANARKFDREALVAMMPAPTHPSPVPDGAKCSACGGSGEVECACCDGEGSIACNKVGCYRDHECRSCDSTGARSCEDCESAVLRGSEGATQVINVFGRDLDVRYLEPLRSMGACTAWAHAEEWASPVLFDDGTTRLLVMPRREGTRIGTVTP